MVVVTTESFHTYTVDPSGGFSYPTTVDTRTNVTTTAVSFHRCTTTLTPWLPPFRGHKHVCKIVNVTTMSPNTRVYVWSTPPIHSRWVHTNDHYTTSSRFPFTCGHFTVHLRHHPPPTSTHPHVIIPDQTTSRDYQSTSYGRFLDTTTGTFVGPTRRLRCNVHQRRSDPGVLSGRLSLRESDLTGIGCPF